nr:MAG TPA: hypothetical protein [Caudoviricetes sp.]
MTFKNARIYPSCRQIRNQVLQKRLLHKRNLGILYYHSI